MTVAFGGLGMEEPDKIPADPKSRQHWGMIGKKATRRAGIGMVIHLDKLGQPKESENRHTPCAPSPCLD